MKSMFFRHDIYIDDISVFQTWHLHWWRQCFQTWHLHWWHQFFSDMISTLWHQCFSNMIFTFLISVCFRHDIYIDDISVFHMTSTFITSVFFRHDIDIDDVSVFQTWYLHLWHQFFSDMTSTSRPFAREIYKYGFVKKYCICNVNDKY